MLAGCGGQDLIALKDREISELRFESERRRQSIIEYLDELEIHRQSQSAFEAERKDLVTRVEDQAVSLRAANELAKQNAQQRDETKKRLADVEEAHVRVKESLDKVKNVASASAVELADLRVKRQELDAQLQVVSRNETLLRDEKKTLVADLDEARSELTRTRAVARSLQEGSAAAQNIALSAQEERIRLLEREIAGLRGENVALHQRVTALSGSTADGEKAAAAAAALAQSQLGVVDGSHYRDHPAGLIVELQGILKDRYARAKQGQIAWDAFDLCVVGVAAIGALFVLLCGVRLARVFRPRSHRHAPQRAEVQQVAEPPARAEVSAPAARSSDSVRVRKSAAARRSSFSAVISNKPGEAAAPGRAATAEDDEEPAGSPDALERALEPAVATAHEEVREVTVKLGKPDPRKVIGARSWSSERPPAEEGEEPLANTQIIPKMVAEEHAALQPVRPPSTAIRRPSVAVPKTTKYPKSEAKPKGSEDKDLLNELKAVINKKFDELIQ